MKHVMKLVLILFVSALVASCASTPSVNDLILLAPNARLLANCKRPILLPDAGMTQRQIEHFWMHDRAALISCGLTKKAVQDFYLQRDNKLSKK